MKHERFFIMALLLNMALASAFFLNLLVASFNNWRVVMNFNAYGEGWIELISFGLIILFGLAMIVLWWKE